MEVGFEYRLPLLFRMATDSVTVLGSWDPHSKEYKRFQFTKVLFKRGCTYSR